MKKIIFALLCCTLYVGFVGCGSKNKSDDTESTEKKEPAKEKYIQLAKEENSKTPVLMPGGIRLDKVEAVSKTVYKYNYTFTQTPAVSQEEFLRNARPMASMALQQTQGKDIDMFKKDKMTLIYAYHLMDGSLFAELIIKPEEYIK